LFGLFILVIVLSVLRFTTSDYPFGVFKLAMHMTRAGLTQIGSIARNWVPHLRAGIIYPRLFQYTQHHTVGPYTSKGGPCKWHAAWKIF